MMPPTRAPARPKRRLRRREGARLRFALACAGLIAATARGGGELNRDGARILIERGIDKLAFVKRLTFSADHVYTEYLNSRWTPGGNICVLDLRTGDVREVVSGLEGGDRCGIKAAGACATSKRCSRSTSSGLRASASASAPPETYWNVEGRDRGRHASVRRRL
ncbi:MAG: hypothetical protein ACYTKD_14675 [Planctomycetota bacterium]|jgi:hypothetical protein